MSIASDKQVRFNHDEVTKTLKLLSDALGQLNTTRTEIALLEERAETATKEYKAKWAEAKALEGQVSKYKEQLVNLRAEVESWQRLYVVLRSQVSDKELASLAAKARTQGEKNKVSELKKLVAGAKKELKEIESQEVDRKSVRLKLEQQIAGMKDKLAAIARAEEKSMRKINDEKADVARRESDYRNKAEALLKHEKQLTLYAQRIQAMAKEKFGIEMTI